MRVSILVFASLLLSVSCDSDDASPEAAPEAKPDESAKPEEKPDTPEPIAPPDPNEACAQGVVVAWAGAEGTEDADPAITRDREAAKARADELLAKATGGATIESLATETDEARSRRKRGGLGTYVREKWPERYGPLAEPLYAAPIGEFTEVVETPIGWAFARRCEVDKVDTSHILVRYAGAERAPEETTRTKDEARALAEEIRAKAAAEGADFAALAGEFGEDGTSKKGGSLGPIGRGMFVPQYEDVAWKLEPGQLSEVVEGPFGFHVIKRAPEAP